jgi:hypothetical protein
MGSLSDDLPTEAELQEAARFAMRCRMLFRRGDGWARVLICSRTLLDKAGVQGWPEKDDLEHQVATIAFALIAARRCARQLAENDPERIESEQLLDKIVGFVWA